MPKIIKQLTFVVADIFLINVSYILAFLLRFDFAIGTNAFGGAIKAYISFWALLTLIKLFVFFIFRVYRNLWQYAESRETVRLILAVIVANIAAFVFLFIFYGKLQTGIAVINLILDMLLISGMRHFHKMSYDRKVSLEGEEDVDLKNAMIIGTGEPAAAVIKEMNLHKGRLGFEPVVIIDDEGDSMGRYICGVKVEGERKDITKLARKYKIDYIFIAMPDADANKIESLINECSKTDCRTKVIPEMSRIIEGSVGVDHTAYFDVEEVLGRRDAKVNSREIYASISGRIVMITGAGNALGSELCRQVCECEPRRVVAVDTDAGTLFNLQRELNRVYPDVEIKPVICPVNETKQVKEIFVQNKPHIVIHNDFYRNMDIMDKNPKEAVRKNIFGTLTVLNEAETHSAEKFVLVSTNKAMYPESIAGATAKIAEMLINLRRDGSKTQNMAIRTANIFEEKDEIPARFADQLEHGAQLTIPHSESVKPYIKAKAAASMILQAMAISRGGEIFSVNLGWSIMIKEFAEYMIKHYGLKLNEDAQIVVDGLCPGERIFEHLTPNKDLVMDTTREDLLTIKAEEFDLISLEKNIGGLWTSVRTGNRNHIKSDLEKIIPGYISESKEQDGQNEEIVI